MPLKSRVGVGYVGWGGLVLQSLPMSDAKKDFARRLRAAMEQAGLEPRAAVLEREFNLRYTGEPMTLHGVRRWLEGEVMPPRGKIEVLAGILKVDAEMLRAGQKAPEVREGRRDWPAASTQDRETLEAYLGLPGPQKRVVREVIWAFAKAAQAD